MCDNPLVVCVCVCDNPLMCVCVFLCVCACVSHLVPGLCEALDEALAGQVMLGLGLLTAPLPVQLHLDTPLLQGLLSLQPCAQLLLESSRRRGRSMKHREEELKHREEELKHR